ncbi:MAG: hypothetical protein IPM82_30020 [Saprospiraceae bacterium]|nr:hypothetical protein [Saprospiraceae bacterium]
MDVLMVKLKSEFERWRDTRDLSNFNAVISNHMNSISQIISVSNCDDIRSEWLAKHFSPIFNEKADCAILISIGQAMSALPPSRILGDTIWEGRMNYDSWARACCINSVFNHCGD